MSPAANTGCYEWGLPYTKPDEDKAPKLLDIFDTHTTLIYREVMNHSLVQLSRNEESFIYEENLKGHLVQSTINTWKMGS